MRNKTISAFKFALLISNLFALLVVEGTVAPSYWPKGVLGLELQEVFGFQEMNRYYRASFP